MTEGTLAPLRVTNLSDQVLDFFHGTLVPNSEPKENVTKLGCQESRRVAETDQQGSGDWNAEDP